MGRVAFLFAGQGAQYTGMGKSLYESSAAAKEVFDKVEQVRIGTKKDCFESTAETLAKTEVTQPCVFTVDIAAAAAFAAATGIIPQAVAGFSLGEMAALTFAGAFSIENGAKLVCERAAAMGKAAGQTPGNMAAVLKLQDEQVEKICAEFKQIYPVNYNCAGQLVVAGSAEEMPKFCMIVKTAGGLARPLAVSGAFHSPFMETAAKEFENILSNSNVLPLKMPVYSNKTAQPYQLETLKKTLAAQIQSPVRWSATVANMLNSGINTFIEFGPGKTLSAFVKRSAPEAKILNVQDAESLKKALEALT